jgi:hypothetical protein
MNAQQFISSYLGPKPGLPANFDANATLAQGLGAGQQLSAAQLGAAGPMFGQLADQQYGSIQRVAGGLDNAYTRDARSALGASMGSAGTMERMAGEELALGRSLSPEQQRQATQSARQAFSARGLGTGQGAAAAEILNRDQYATQREQQRRGFASQLLEASGGMRQRGALAMTQVDPFGRAIQGGLSLGQTAQGLGMDTIGRAYQGGLDFFGNANTFNINRGDSLYNAWLNNATAAQTGQMAANAQTQAANTQAAATRAARPTWWETTLGAVGNIFSDERMKTDVKPLGTAGNVLGLTAYEFRYKGDKKKHKGFMAQDVQKVLPEAVEEVDYQGKKRLTIKPMVIGAALAEELMAAKAA